ncbi:MAG: hypothetical protein ACR2HH_16855 [Chthoniobacterales bacterium]
MSIISFLGRAVLWAVVGFVTQLGIRYTSAPFSSVLSHIFKENWGVYTMLGFYGFACAVFGVWFLLGLLSPAVRGSRPSPFTTISQKACDVALNVVAGGFGLQIGALFSTVGSANDALRFTSAASALSVFILAAFLFHIRSMQNIPAQTPGAKTFRTLFGIVLVLQLIYIGVALALGVAAKGRETA